MKPTYYLLALLPGVSFFLFACQAPPTHDHAHEVNVDSVKAIITAIEADFVKASNANDVDALTKFYAPDAESYSSDGALIGIDSIRAAMTASAATDTSGATLAYTVTGVWAAGNIAVETGTATRTAKDGKVLYTGRYMGLYELRDGKYVTLREISVKDASAETPSKGE